MNYIHKVEARKANVNEYKRIISRHHLYEFGVYLYSFQGSIWGVKASPPNSPASPPKKLWSFRSLNVVSQNHKYSNAPDCTSAHIHFQEIWTPLEYSWPSAARSATRTDVSPKRKILDRTLVLLFKQSVIVSYQKLGLTPMLRPTSKYSLPIYAPGKA